MTSPSPAASSQAASRRLRLPLVSAKDLLEYFQTHMQPSSESGNTKEVPPERISLKGFCEDVQDLTPRTRRAVLNCGIDFHDEVIAMPTLRDLPQAARGHQEAEAKWLHHLGVRRFDVVELLESERSRMIEQFDSLRRERDTQQQNNNNNQNNQNNSNKLSPRTHSATSSRISSPRSKANSGTASLSQNSKNNNNKDGLMDPAELQAQRAARREQAMMEAMQKKLAAQERVRQQEERAMALAQLALKRQKEQERAAKLAKERAEKVFEQKKRERAEQEYQKALHRREVQQMRDELEKALHEEQLKLEAEKDMTVEERRKARADRLKAQRAELEAKRIEQRERLTHLQRSIEEAEERRKREFEERMKQAEMARQKQIQKKEEVLAMNSLYQDERTQIYRERKAKIEEAEAASITRFIEKGEAAVEKRDEILNQRQQILKNRILQHAQREIQAKKIRRELDKQEEEEAKLLEDRLSKQERRAKKVLQAKSDEAKMRLAEKQMVSHDHRMHANHIHKMQEVRQLALEKKFEQKLKRIEQLKEDAQELEQYRKGLRHILDQGGDFFNNNDHHHVSDGRSRSPSHHANGAINHDVKRDQARLLNNGRHRALTPMPSSVSGKNNDIGIYQLQSGASNLNNPGPAAYDVVRSDLAIHKNTTGPKFGNNNNTGLARMEPVSRASFGGFQTNTVAPLTPEPRH